MGWRTASRCGQYCFETDAPRPPRNFLRWRTVFLPGLPGRNASDDSTSNTVRLECPRRSGRDMITPDDRASTDRCDADTTCQHIPCFQVQLEASRPRHARRQANACAYHVPDVIETLRTWAGEHDLGEGQLTILVIEPAAGRPLPSQPGLPGPGQPGEPGGPGQPELRGFAFSTIPLTPVQRRDPTPPSAREPRCQPSQSSRPS
jgi:hypothetical protein